MSALFERKTIEEAAHSLGVPYDGVDAAFKRVCTDSRTVQPGDFFVALAGPNFDGHDYVESAFDKGAVVAMVSHKLPLKIPQLVVSNTLHGLGDLARAYRVGFSHPLIGVTGSNGKTTVKEMLGSILSLSGPVHVTQGNLNNEIGVPLTLLQLESEDEFAVIEMGANHKGEIAYLSRLALPDIGLVTNAGAAHLEGFGSLEGVAEAKGELFQNLANSATAIINLDDRFAARWLEMSEHCNQLTFGENEKADVQIRAVVQQQSSMAFKLSCNGETIDVNLKVLGTHNVLNAAAAAATCIAAGRSLNTIKQGLERFEPVSGRLKYVDGLNGAQVIDDAYNANPSSMRAAIDVLSNQKGKRILVMGDMLELGDNAAVSHREMGAYAKKVEIDFMFATGGLCQSAVEAFGDNAEYFDDLEELIKSLQPLLDADTTVLVKASRGMHLEKVVAAISQQDLSAA
jgi:UDP-N-acetylmuramoyl-tripeptide--D-alanyl-D-alanine ligase